MAWLREIAATTSTTLVPLVAGSGTEIECVLPLFETRVGGLKLAFSPPPACAVPLLGPVFSFASDNRRNQESFYESVVEDLQDFARAERYGGLTVWTGLQDARPWDWNGFRVRPSYEYRIPVAQGSEEDLLNGFDRVARKAVRRALKEAGLEIVDGGAEMLSDLHEMIQSRYKEQGKTWTVSKRYLQRLFSIYGGSEMRIRGILHDGEFVSGLVLMHHRDVLQGWVGGTAPVKPLPGAIELLHYSNLLEAQRLGCSVYSIGGANVPHLCRSKARFNPELVVHFEADQSSLAARLVKGARSSSLARRMYLAMKSS